MHSTKQIINPSHFHCSHVLCWGSLLIVLLAGGSIPLPSAAQSNASWGNSFDRSSTQGTNARASYNAWSAPHTASPSEGYNADDPWGTENAWSTRSSWRHNPQIDSEPPSNSSDWSGAFYDMSNRNKTKNGNTVREHIGDGPSKMSSPNACNGNPNNPSCTEACSGANPPPSCVRACSDPSSTACQNFCETNPTTPSCQRLGFTGTSNPTDTPIPGLVYLLLAGLGYGGYRLREQHTA